MTIVFHIVELNNFYLTSVLQTFVYVYRESPRPACVERSVPCTVRPFGHFRKITRFNFSVLNYLVLPSKYYVYLCRCNEVKPSFPTFLVVTKNKYHEKMCRLSNTEGSRDNAKQKRIVKLFKKSSQARARIFRWGGGVRIENEETDY